VKRLTYLAEVRNRLLRPLDPPSTATPLEPLVNYTNTRFDRLLFINDIYFKPEDALNLLFSTNVNPATGLAEYQGACSMDFVRGGTLYDSFVIRDLDGFEISWFLYPWFTRRGSGQSRQDVLRQKDAVRVRSCWSGMAAYDATPFLRQEVVDANHHPTRPLPHLEHPLAQVDPTSNSMKPIQGQSQLDLRANLAPLRFRHQSELFWEASECCLLNADLLARSPEISIQLFLNPYIRVAYDWKTWVVQPWLQRFERGFATMEFVADVLALGWDFNTRRTEVVGRPTVIRKWVYDNPALNGETRRNHTVDMGLGLQFPLSPEQTRGEWKLGEQVAEAGGFCGQRTLFVMMSDLEKANSGKSGRNWEKIKLPPRR
jgi:hypothetical protein